MNITLANLAQATEQEVYDQIAVHLLTQDQKSLDKFLDSCSYRGDGGRKCAGGCLVGDDEYRPWMDDHLELSLHLRAIGKFGPTETVKSTGWDTLAQYGLVPSKHLHLITKLQKVHDGSHPSMWREQLEHVAETFKLSPEVLTRFA